jgi:hypothetical protein
MWGLHILQSIRKHWIECDPRSIHLKELDPLLHDYQQLVASAQEYVDLWNEKLLSVFYEIIKIGRGRMREILLS